MRDRIELPQISRGIWKKKKYKYGSLFANLIKNKWINCNLVCHNLNIFTTDRKYLNVKRNYPTELHLSIFNELFLFFVLEKKALNLSVSRSVATDENSGSNFLPIFTLVGFHFQWTVKRRLTYTFITWLLSILFTSNSFFRISFWTE